MNDKELKQLEEEIKQKQDLIERYKYKQFILSLEHDELISYIDMKNEKIKELQNKLKQIEEILED